MTSLARVLSRQQLEICLFSYLATEFKTGDACVVGSESYADFREQLLTTTECEPIMEDYCRQLNFPGLAVKFAKPRYSNSFQAILQDFTSISA